MLKRKKMLREKIKPRVVPVIFLPSLSDKKDTTIPPIKPPMLAVSKRFGISFVGRLY
jgi:hypothetical protein